MLFAPLQLVVAVKKLDLQKIEELGEQQTVQRELTFLTNTRQCFPHGIQQFYGYYQDESCVYLVSEYTSNGTLANVMNNIDACERDTTIKYIMYKCVQAVKEMHELGWSHRDIKPQNILISEEGQIQLIDFGTSKQLTAQESDLLRNNRTCTRKPSDSESQNAASEYFNDERQSFVGTDKYLPPEVNSGKQQYGILMDVYSLGMTFYEFLVLNNYNYDNNIEHELEDLIKMMTNTEPKQRLPDGWTGLLSHKYFKDIDTKNESYLTINQENKWKIMIRHGNIMFNQYNYQYTKILNQFEQIIDVLGEINKHKHLVAIFTNQFYLIFIGDKWNKRFHLFDPEFKFFYCNKDFHILIKGEEFIIQDIEADKYQLLAEKIFKCYQYDSKIPTLCPSCKDKYFYNRYCHKCNTMILQMQLTNVGDVAQFEPQFLPLELRKQILTQALQEQENDVMVEGNFSDINKLQFNDLFGGADENKKDNFIDFNQNLMDQDLELGKIEIQVQENLQWREVQDCFNHVKCNSFDSFYFKIE